MPNITTMILLRFRIPAQGTRLKDYNFQTKEKHFELVCST